MRLGKTSYLLQSPAQLGVYLKSLRKSRGLTQEDLGRRIRVSGARVSEIEKDPGALGLTQLLKLLHVLGARVVLDVDETKQDTASQRKTLSGGEW